MRLEPSFLAPVASYDVASSIYQALSRGIHLTLLANNPKDYVHKALVEEEAAGTALGLSTPGDAGAAPGAVAAAAGAAGAAMYEAGALTAMGKEVAVYLTVRVAKFPEVMEALVKRHTDKGDEMSALVTCDLYKTTFDGWGRAQWHTSEIYTSLGRAMQVDGVTPVLKAPMVSALEPNIS
jgi:hypothetical protein